MTYEFHVIPLTHLDVQYQEWDIQKGFDEIYYEDDEKERIRNIADDLFKVVKKTDQTLRNQDRKAGNQSMKMP